MNRAANRIARDDLLIRVMIALFVWLFFVSWREFNHDIDAEKWPAAAANLKRIHKIILVSLLLGVISLVAGGTGHLWG